MSSATILICTSGRPELLDRAITAIADGSRLPDQLVIVNGSDGQSPEIVSQHAARFNDVVLVEHPNRNLATLRNLGLPLCTRDIIAMTDDDAIPDSEWLVSAVASHAEHPGAGGIGGPVSGVSDSFVSRLSDAVVFPRPRPGQAILTLPTVNMSYKRAVMEAVGEFDETLFRGEDVDYNWRVTQAGHELRYELAMKVRHEHRSSLAGFLQQQYMYGRAYVLVRSKWTDMYAVYPRSLRSLRSWAKLAFALLAILYQPLQQARSMHRPADRARAYPVLVVHHLVWKLAMLRQATVRSTPVHAPTQSPVITRWSGGVLVSS